MIRQRPQRLPLVAFLLCVLFIVSRPTDADPLAWESDFGSSLNALSGQDDKTTQVTLSFDFPLFGVGYRKLFIGTNGVITVGREVEAFYKPVGNPFDTCKSTALPFLAPTMWSMARSIGGC